MCDKDPIEYEVPLTQLSYSVARLFKAVQEGRYDERSIVGDEVLLMKAALKEVGIELPLDKL